MKRLISDDEGQDLAEYALLLGAIVLGLAGVLIGIGQNINIIWSIINSRLAAANQGP